MSGNGNGNRPTFVGGPGGLTPGMTPATGTTNTGTYSTYNQPPRRNRNANNFGIGRSGFGPLEEEASIASASDDADKILESLEEMRGQIEDALKRVRLSERVAERARESETMRASEAALFAESAEESARKAEEAIKESENSRKEARKAIDTLEEAKQLVGLFKKDAEAYRVSDMAEQARLSNKIANIDKQMKNLEQSIKELSKEEKVTPKVVEEIKDGLEQIEMVVKADMPMRQRGKMGICFIKFEGHTNILNPYASDKNRKNVINPILPVNFNVNLEGLGDFADVPAGNYLFIDNFKLRLDDFKNMNRTDFIELILDPLRFVRFIEALERSSVERQFFDFRKKEQLSNEERKIYKENAKIYAAKLFATELPFNIVYQRGGFYFNYSIMNHEIMKKNIEGPDAFRFDIQSEKIRDETTDTIYTFFSFKVKLILNESSQITENDVKKVGCDQRRIKIQRIMGSLDGTRNLITAFLGAEGAKQYLVDDTRMEQLNVGRAKPLPSKKRQYSRNRSILDKLSFQTQVPFGNISSSIMRTENDDRRRLEEQERRSRQIGGSIKTKKKRKTQRKNKKSKKTQRKNSKIKTQRKNKNKEN